jgi:anti-sigma regulatory factor (Ser/Thr protein kinase)
VRRWAGGGPARRKLATFALPSELGNKRATMEMVAEAVRDLDLPGERLEKLRTAVAEAAMDAMEHDNHVRPELPVTVLVFASAEDLGVRITDRGGDPIPGPGGEATAKADDLTHGRDI